jgi:nucleotide-binding universal stress UspA family protein
MSLRVESIAPPIESRARFTQSAFPRRAIDAQGKRPARLRLERILVPLDFSACSRRGLQYAVDLALRFNARLILVHIIRSTRLSAIVHASANRELEWELHAHGEKDLAELAKQHLDPEISVQMRVRIGRPATEIVAAARECNADLILLSTHGRTGLTRRLVGSTAEEVVRLAHCPVMVV